MEPTLGQMPAEVLYIGSGSDDAIMTERIVSPGCFLFIFVKAGMFTLKIDGKRISCTSGEFVVAVSKQHHEILKYGKKVLCYIVKVQWQFIMGTKLFFNFIEAFVSSGAVKLFPDTFDRAVMLRIMKLLHYFYGTRSSPSRFSKPSFAAAVSLLVLQAGWQYNNSTNTGALKYTRKESLAMQFLKLLMQHFRKEHALKFYADALFVTAGYLNKAVREVTGKTVGMCIADVITSEAKYLLETSDDSIESISEQLSFGSSGSFSRFFKKHTTMTPNAYRRDYQG
ncbi:helix-turn-helix domain-containing protein [Flavobacterium zepuense]|uniref:Helix-turn-helix domain-containing protein n=1 Tax=Flavobacterium zepuense TaxID=2593302 RepID=A0A552UZH4_9FLAO|nr:helix-turn-helix domain-containing protein [Flavobacterium zepuense]TRW23634.1 helix-turn-helix domain-containing protein [Flavobacterium zepuense]